MIPRTIAEIVLHLLHGQEELERRFENRERTGTIHEVDAEKGLARVKLGEDKNGQPFLTPWIPWMETAMGFIRTHFPPEVGEQVKVVSESGDLTDAVIVTSIPSNQFKRPHNKTREGRIQVGEKTTITFTEDQFLVQTPHYRVETGKAEYVKSGGGGSKPGAAVT